MDAATRVQLSGLVFTLLVPAAAVILTLFVGRRLVRDVEARPMVVGLATLAGLFAAHVGVLGRPTFPVTDAHHWVLFAAWAAAAAGLAADRFRPPARPFVIGAIAVALIGLFTWRLLAPLASLWDAGVLAPLSQSAYVLDAAALLLVTWLAVDHAAREAPAPAVLGPLALAFAAAAGAVSVSGSASIAQACGAMGVAVGAVALAGWRWPDLRPGHGAVGAAVLAYGLLVIYGHHYVDMPRRVTGLLLVAPAGVVAARAVRRTVPAVLLALAAVLPPALGALYLAKAADDAKMAEDQGADDSPDYDYSNL